MFFIVPYDHMKPSASIHSRHIGNSNKELREKKAHLDFVKTLNSMEIG